MRFYRGNRKCVKYKVSSKLLNFMLIKNNFTQQRLQYAPYNNDNGSNQSGLKQICDCNRNLKSWNRSLDKRIGLYLDFC